MKDRASMLLKSRTAILCFSIGLCKKKINAIRHMNRLLFSNHMIHTVVRLQEVSRAKELLAKCRT